MQIKASAGVAVVVQALTDNRTSTAPEIKKLFEKAGGSVGIPGCVAWQFKPRAVFLVGALAKAGKSTSRSGHDRGGVDGPHARHSDFAIAAFFHQEGHPAIIMDLAPLIAQVVCLG